MKRRRWSLLTALALVAGLVAVGPQASAAPVTFDIQVGAFPGNPSRLPAESMRYFPRVMDAHQGDTLHFTSDSFHSATFMLANVDPDQWVADNATAFDDPFAATVADPDEGPKAAKFGLTAFLPTDDSCGTPDNPCSVDGTDVMNSGLPIFGPLDFSATLDVAPGTTLDLFCVIHSPMRMTINVVADATAIQSQDDIDADTAEKIAKDKEKAQNVHKRFSNRHTKTVRNGRRIWDAYPGVDRGHISLLAMYPRQLEVRKGDKVKWHFEELKFETHTVSMPRSRSKEEGNADFQPSCDPDGDGGPLPDVPPTNPADPFSCPAGTEPEVDRNRAAYLLKGNGNVKGYKDFESSGERGPSMPAPPSEGLVPYKLKFKERSDPGKPFRYLCIIHRFMRGSVTVD
ncbi:MAG: hypothetical protein ACRDKF_05010 [Actinomycetota bacterium]